MKWGRTRLVTLWLVFMAACAGTESGNPSSRGGPLDAGADAHDEAGEAQRRCLHVMEGVDHDGRPMRVCMETGADTSDAGLDDDPRDDDGG